jgi:hypothetical protein
MDDPNKSAKEAFQRMLESGQLSSSAYLPSRLQLQRAVWQLQKENNELKRKIDELERPNKTRTKNNPKGGNAGRSDDCNHVEVKG